MTKQKHTSVMPDLIRHPEKEHWIAQSSWAMTTSLGWFNLAG
jgi:hypothetical protein